MGLLSRKGEDCCGVFRRGFCSCFFVLFACCLVVFVVSLVLVGVVSGGGVLGGCCRVVRFRVVVSGFVGGWNLVESISRNSCHFGSESLFGCWLCSFVFLCFLFSVFVSSSDTVCCFRWSLLAFFLFFWFFVFFVVALLFVVVSI
ncbi:unnamed protein product [Polarella glacialis]|uniref:Uncharacterized protein n=1 Tax=Polarella glacialis TaxID=89957 RepID=A0A813H472_POLGL|nr:unnamed protein product [Polarella glacialis]